MEKPQGKFRCVICGKECDGSELHFDPNHSRWECSDFFCGANVVRIAENSHEYRIRKVSVNNE